jgi:hypothetical protein
VPIDHAFDSRWVPPVGGAPSRHTGTGGAADGVHDHYLRDSGAGDRSPTGRSRVAPRTTARQAAIRGDVEQPRRCAGRQAGAHRRGEDSPLTGLADLKGGLRLSSGGLLERVLENLTGLLKKRSTPRASRIDSACLY